MCGVHSRTLSRAHAQVTRDVATFKFTVDSSEEEVEQERKRKRPNKPILKQPVREPFYPPSSPTVVEQVSPCQRQFAAS